MTPETMQDIFNGDTMIFPYMKEQYRDICSNRDLTINRMLDALERRTFKQQNYPIFLVEHVIDTYIHRYLAGHSPEP